MLDGQLEPLIMALRGSDPRPDIEIIGQVLHRRPVWLRVNNFWERPLALLRALPRPQLVLWKLEYFGDDTIPQVIKSPSVDLSSYVHDMLSLRHHVVPYTFHVWNRDRLRHLVPELSECNVAILPLAQKSPTTPGPRRLARRRLGIPEAGLVIGCGGRLRPHKGIDEIVEGFLRGHPDPQARLLCGLVVEDGVTAEELRNQWRHAFGEDRLDRVHVHVSNAYDWSWMCAFYRSIDQMFVNSTNDSWARIIAEPVGFGVPTLVRRARCVTNHLAQDLVLVDDFGDLCSKDHAEAIANARLRAPKLARDFNTAFSLDRVRTLYLDLMRAETPPQSRARFERSAADPAQLRELDGLTVW